MNSYAGYFFDASFDQKQNVALNYFWVGIGLYAVSYALSTTGQIDFKLCNLFQLIALLMCVTSSCFLIQYKFEKKYLKLIFTAYCFWSFLLVMRGLQFNYDSIKFFLFNAQFGGIIYLTPLILLFPKSLFYYKKLFIVIVGLSAVFILCDLYFIKDLLTLAEDGSGSRDMLERFSLHLSLPSGFILLTYLYHSKKRLLLALSVVLITLLLAVVQARRGLIFMNLSMLAVAMVLYFNLNKKSLIKIFISLLLLGILFTYTEKAIQQNKSGIFTAIQERLLADTRGGVEICFFEDMNHFEWIAGKGLNGQYFCPGIDPGNTTGYRKVIETGFLQIILKGGIISLALFLLLAIPAIVKGFFYSNNLFSKAAAAWIFLSLLFSYPSTIHSFSLYYLLVWLCIGICYSKPIRALPDRVFMMYFSNQLIRSRIKIHSNH